MSEKTLIEVTVIAYGKIRRYLQGEPKRTFKLKIESSVRDLFRLLGKPDGEIWMVNVNGLLANEEYVLKDRDEVRLFKPVGGGQPS
ncbi:hypothetical protein DRO58_03480 [Candidatus Bathyarchaeota archaeon]|nr:MAG: hypothetical protein DRO58_03480 [Candidatus Bathyarchaeota archaeon]